MIKNGMLSLGIGNVKRYLLTRDLPFLRLRFHPTQEWHDLYQPTSIEDFKRFLDYYTKDIQNGWESTARVRVAAIRYNQV
jgi:predicted acyl esterase